MTFENLTSKHAVVAPQGQMVLELVVDIADRVDMGASPQGHRFIIPITGGEFRGEFDGQAIAGEVLAGGADRQLLRADGILELAALYEIKTEDGAVITVDNQVMVDTRPGAAPPRSVVRLKAPDGPYSWMNRRVFVGTLNPLLPDRKAVLIRIFALS